MKRAHAPRRRSCRDRAAAARRRRMVEMIVADERAIGLAAELAEFLLVDRLEQRALVPVRARIEPQVAVELLLGDVHHLDLQRRVGLGVVDEVVQPAPGAFDLLERLVVQDLVDLRRQLLVQLGDHLVDRVEHVVLDQARVGEGLLNQRSDRVLDFGRCALAARLEALLQDRREIVGLLIGRTGRGLSRCSVQSPPACLIPCWVTP